MDLPPDRRIPRNPAANLRIHLSSLAKQPITVFSSRTTRSSTLLMSPSSPPPSPPSPLQSVSLLWSVCKLDSLFESAASFRISSLASPLLLSLSLPLSPELAHGVLRPRTPPLMGLYSNFGLWFSPGFPLARETSQGNGGSKRVRAGLEEGQRFPTLQQPPTRMEIAFRLIPTERSNPPLPPRDAIHLFLSSPPPNSLSFPGCRGWARPRNAGF